MEKKIKGSFMRFCLVSLRFALLLFFFVLLASVFIRNNQSYASSVPHIMANPFFISTLSPNALAKNLRIHDLKRFQQHRDSNSDLEFGFSVRNSNSIFHSLLMLQSSNSTHIANMIKRVVEQSQKSSSLEDWHLSFYSPSLLDAVIENNEANVLCSAISTLNTQEFALIEHYLSEHETLMPCLQESVKSFEQYHLKNQKQFKQALKNKALNSLIKLGPKQENPFKGFVFVDTIGGQVVYSRNPVTGQIQRLGLKKTEIVLSFDDGPHSTRSLAVAEVLNSFGIRANFFAVGKQAQAHPEVIQKIFAQGHIYGSHTQTHHRTPLPQLPYDTALAQIQSGHLNVMNAQSVDSGFFRFPYGSFNTALVQYLQGNKISHFFWNIDSEDWKHTNLNVLYNKIISELNREQSGLMLFHDIHAQTLSVLPNLLKEMQNAGYVFYLAVPIDWKESYE